MCHVRPECSARGIFHSILYKPRWHECILGLLDAALASSACLDNVAGRLLALGEGGIKKPKDAPRWH